MPEGIISSQLADDESGRHLCPIVIRALPGQRVNITLFDFGSAISQVGRGLQATSVVCQRYALIKEKTSASPTIVCSGNERTRGVYVSDGNVVEIQLVHTRHRKESAHFLLRYSGEVLILTDSDGQSFGPKQIDISLYVRPRLEILFAIKSDV